MKPSSLNKQLIQCSCLRNVVALFHVIEKEKEWRRARGQLEGFEAMSSSRPIVAIGPEHPLEETILMADYFRESYDCPVSLSISVLAIEFRSI